MVLTHVSPCITTSSMVASPMSPEGFLLSVEVLCWHYTKLAICDRCDSCDSSDSNDISDSSESSDSSDKKILLLFFLLLFLNCAKTKRKKL